MEKILILFSKLFLGKGIDKKFPFLVLFYKRLFLLFVKEKVLEVKIPLSLKLLVSSKDSGLGMYLRTKGVFEPLMTKIFLDSVKTSQIVFDIGANVGYYTILAAKKVGEKGKVYAFEPDPRNILLLKKNIVLNKLKNVVVVEKALGKKTKEEIFTQDLANPGESALSKEKEGKKIKVATITLDSFTRLKNIKNIDVIKMDIEGGEIDVIEGGKDILKKIKNTLVFVEVSVSPSLLLKRIKELGFKEKLIIDEFKKTVKKFTSKNFEDLLKKVSYVSLVLEK